MRRIKLTQGFTALVDDGDYERVIAAGPWHACRSRHTVYAKHSVRKDGKCITVRLHHFILGVNSIVEIDHKDHNGLNNQKHNLRKAGGKNTCNVVLYSSNTSGFKGVSAHKTISRPVQWKAQVRHKGEVHYIGLFPTAKQAALAYDRKARELFGEFAYTNFKEIK